jgi:hypothetical protein
MFTHTYDKTEVAAGFLKNKHIKNRPVNLIENSLDFFQKAFEQDKKIITIVSDVTRYGPYRDQPANPPYERRKVNRYEFRLSVALLNPNESNIIRNRPLFYWKLGIRKELLEQLPNTFVDAYAPCMEFEYPTLVQPISAQPLTILDGRETRYDNFSPRLKLNRCYGRDYRFGIHAAIPIQAYKWIPVIEAGAEAVLDQFFPDRHNGIYI